MKRHGRILTLLSLLVLTVPISVPSRAAMPFADAAFENVWTRTDSLVGQSNVQRGYLWGPSPGFSLQEDYDEGANGKRLVQYFDKGRMEINNPSSDRSSRYFVTSGLLAIELISGRVQVGDNRYVESQPAQINIASDADDPDAPTYASFTYRLKPAANLVGDSVTSIIKRNEVVAGPSRSDDTLTKIAYYEPNTGHNVPTIFWNHLNQSGKVISCTPVRCAKGQDGRLLVSDGEQLSAPWSYLAGYPIAEAYWAKVKISGQLNTDVLIQPYERRVLTYVPSAPPAYRVQMGNIGQHYYDWRYKDLGKYEFHPDFCGTKANDSITAAWLAISEMNKALHCPTSNLADAVVTLQGYQHGSVLEVVDQYPTYQYHRAFLLGENKTASQLTEDDIRRHGIPIPAAFGAKVDAPLVTTGHLLQFSLGFAVATPIPLRQIYIIYDSSGNSYCCVNQWRTYPDNYADGPIAANPSACASIMPTGAIGKLWNANILDQAALGCPFTIALDAQVPHEDFEYGTMLDTVQDIGEHNYERGIYVLYDDGRAAFYEDTYLDGSDPGGTETPPARLYAPKFGFGKVWREHPEVRQGLGWAKRPETSSAGSYQQFDFGMVILTGVTAKQAFVIYDTSRSGGILKVDKWRVYPDTYSP